MIPQCGQSVIQVMFVRVDIGVVIYAAMIPKCGKSVVQVLVVRMDTGVVIYEAMTPLCGRSVVQFPAIIVDMGMVYNTPVWEGSGSGPVCQSEYTRGDL